MMINEKEINSNKSVRNYYKSNLSNEYKKLKASLFLGEKISDEYIFSLIINATYMDDTQISSRAHFLLSKPLKDQHILFLIEYFRVVINKDYEHDRRIAPKLLKILMRRGYKSLLIKLILDSKNKKLRDFLLERVEAHKSKSDREQLFLIYELWKSKIISRNEADMRLQLFVNNYKARQTFLSKPFSRKQAMAYMLVSIIYLQMNLVKKGNSLFEQIATNGVWTEKVVRTWYNDIEETYEKDIYENDKRLAKTTGTSFKPVTFESKFPEICEQFKKNLKTDFQDLISQPINYSQLICNGLKSTNLIIYANETLNHTRNLQISESAFNLYTLINKSTGHIYDHKALLSYIPALKTLNNEFAESKTTKKFNKYFMSKNNYYHSALFLLLPKEAFKDNGLDFNQLEEKFIKAFLRYRFYSGYGKSYRGNSYRFYGSPKKITVIYKYIYLYGDYKMRAWLEDLAILKTLVSSSHSEIEKLTSASIENCKEFSLALNYHLSEIGDKYFENINAKINTLFKINFFERGFRENYRDLLDFIPVDEITALVKKAYENKNNNDMANALKVLSLLDFYKQDRPSNLNRYLSDKNFMKYLELFCTYMYKAIQNNSSIKKLRISYSHGMSIKPLNLINKLIFFYCRDKVYERTIKKDSSDSVLLHLKAMGLFYGSLSELALKRYQQLKEAYKNKSKKLVMEEFSECIKDISFDNYPFFKRILNNILFGSLIENFGDSQVKKIIEEYHVPKKLNQNKFIKFITFLNESFFYIENYYYGSEYEEMTLEEEYRSSLEKIIKDLISDYAKIHDIKESKLHKLFLDNQYRSLSYDEHTKEFNDLAILFNKEPEKYFFELWSDMHYRLFIERTPRLLNPKIDKEKFYNQLDTEIKKLTSINLLNDSQLSLLSSVLKILSDAKDKSYWVGADKKTIAVINKHKSTLLDYLMKKINLKTNGFKSLEFFKLIPSNSNLFISRKAQLESFLISVIKNKSFNYDQKYKFLLEIYNDRSALKLFGKAAYQNLIDSFIESLKSQIKYKKTSNILKHRFSSIDELAKVQILKIYKSKIRLTYLQKDIINSRIQDLKLSRENCSFCKENNFDYWALHLSIYG
jgi:hypothetical protein